MTFNIYLDTEDHNDVTITKCRHFRICLPIKNLICPSVNMQGYHQKYFQCECSSTTRSSNRFLSPISPMGRCLRVLEPWPRSQSTYKECIGEGEGSLRVGKGSLNLKKTNTRSLVYQGQHEIGLVLVLKFYLLEPMLFMHRCVPNYDGKNFPS